jgi:regulator of sigma E protease
VTQVVKDSPAAQAGIMIGDVVQRVGDERVTESSRFVELIGQRKGEAVSLYIAPTLPDGTVPDTSRQITVVPRVNPPAGEGALGVAVVTSPVMAYEKQPWYRAPWVGITEGSYESSLWAREMFRIFSHPRELFSQMSGPVAVVRVGAEAVSAGWVTTLRFVGILSINLAIFNLLPFPALDGGRLLFVGLGMIVGRRRVARVEGYANMVGMGLLILLLIGVTVKDIWFR